MNGDANKIDIKIKGLVSALNSLGINTTGSCEGHVNYGSPAPWITITPRNKKDGIELLKVVSQLLNSFYKNHIPEEDARFITENANVGFWIHNGGDDYIAWRKAIKERVKKHKAGINVREILTAKEKNGRKKTLPVYQKEIIFFTNFLKQKFREKYVDK